MRYRLLCKVMVCLGIALFNIGGCNLFSDLTDKNFDAAILDEIENCINSGRYTEAIDKFATLSAVAREKRENRFLLASAYSGRAGLDVIDLAMKLSAPGTDSFFKKILSAFKGRTNKNFWDAVAAREIITAIAPTGPDRTINENVFMIFNEMAVIGTILASTADQDGDGENDPFFDNCRTTNISDLGGVEDILAIHMVVAIANLLKSVSAAGTSISGLDLSSITTYICSDSIPLGNICEATSTGVVSSDMMRISRTLIGETNLGIGLKVINPGDTLSTDKYEILGPSAGGVPLFCP